jgi:hypothetical protein
MIDSRHVIVTATPMRPHSPEELRILRLREIHFRIGHSGTFSGRLVTRRLLKEKAIEIAEDGRYKLTARGLGELAVWSL